MSAMVAFKKEVKTRVAKMVQENKQWMEFKEYLEAI